MEPDGLIFSTGILQYICIFLSTPGIFAFPWARNKFLLASAVMFLFTCQQWPNNEQLHSTQQVRWPEVNRIVLSAVRERAAWLQYFRLDGKMVARQSKNGYRPTSTIRKHDTNNCSGQNCLWKDNLGFLFSVLSLGLWNKVEWWKTTISGGGWMKRRGREKRVCG